MKVKKLLVMLPSRCHVNSFSIEARFTYQYITPFPGVYGCLLAQWAFGQLRCCLTIPSAYSQNSFSILEGDPRP